MVQTSEPFSPKPGDSTTYLIAKSGICLVGAVLALVFAGVSLLRAYEASLTRNWPSTEGTITSSSVEASSSGKRTRYGIKVRYAYRVGEREFTSDQLSAIGTPSHLRHSFRGAAEEQLAREFVVGMKKTVYYNPAKPERAVLEHQMSVVGYAWAMLPLSIAALGGHLGYQNGRAAYERLTGPPRKKKKRKRSVPRAAADA